MQIFYKYLYKYVMHVRLIFMHTHTHARLSSPTRKGKSCLKRGEEVLGEALAEGGRQAGDPGRRAVMDRVCIFAGRPPGSAHWLITSDLLNSSSATWMTITQTF